MGYDIEQIEKILDGDDTKSSQYGGYKRKQTDHKEGDIWEEDGIKWTIKDGIIQTINKMDGLREQIKFPLSCPSCGKKMIARIDARFWQLNRTCMHCVIEEDTKRMANGTFKQYEERKILGNKLTTLRMLRDYYIEYLNDIDTNHFVTEQGDIEDWSNQYDNTKIKESIHAKILDIGEQIKKMSELLKIAGNEVV
jgi:ribosomal protein L37AE/L43A